MACNKHVLDKYGPNRGNYADRAAVKGAEEMCTHHSKSLYMIVKKTWRNKLTAFMRTASRYSHASPDIMRYHSLCGENALTGELYNASLKDDV